MIGRLSIGVNSLLAGSLVGTPEGKLATLADALSAQAEAEVKKAGYGKAVGPHIESFHSAMRTLLKTAAVAFNEFTNEPDRTVTESAGIAALKALPHLLDEALRATLLMHMILDMGPIWSIEQRNT